jgi:FtsZ-interacting cell division protein ZipA
MDAGSGRRAFLIEKWEAEEALARSKRERKKTKQQPKEESAVLSDDDSDLGEMETGSRESKESRNSFPRRHKKRKPKKDPGYHSETPQVQMATMRSELRRDMATMVRTMIRPDHIQEQHIQQQRHQFPSYQHTPLPAPHAYEVSTTNRTDDRTVVPKLYVRY